MKLFRVGKKVGVEIHRAVFREKTLYPFDAFLLFPLHVYAIWKSDGRD